MTEIEIRSDNEVIATECCLDGAWTLDASGQMIDDKLYCYLGRLQSLKAPDGVWRVSDIEKVSEAEGKVGCAEQLA
jgi:hypothetical protein